ncbi:MAG: exodeoxyribonuclease III [Polyangiaceae bacterium]|nr:exodeoxyribonuclease III [Polyangiaceae bacterium]
MEPRIEIASWNVNGIRARLDGLKAWLGQNPVDVLCVQETKASNDVFPVSVFEQMGYASIVHGQKSYNGVALLVKDSLLVDRVQADVVCGLAGDDQARLVGATIGGIRVFSAYFPNGQAVGADKYVYKLKWIEGVTELMAREVGNSKEVVLCGDFNIAPEPVDTHDPSIWEGKILCSDAERASLGGLRAVGFHDAYRLVHPSVTVYTWWDYRGMAFAKNHGLRIDHVCVTDALVPRVLSVDVDVRPRSWEQPSDHAPVVLGLRGL